MRDETPILLWLRRDFRLSDHPMLSAAAASGRPVLALFILDPLAEAYGAAPKWRLEQALAAFAPALEACGVPLVLRRGPALAVLRQVLAESGAGAVWWSRDLDPVAIARDTEVKTALRAEGFEARSFDGQLLFAPWAVQTGQGGPYRVYTPYWRAVRGLTVAPPLAPVTALRPGPVLRGESLSALGLDLAMRRGAAIVAKYARVGEAAARARLQRFLQDGIETYQARRDFLAENATSELSEHLAWGEISPRAIWHAGAQAMAEGRAGAETFLKELVWREFAWHLMFYYPRLATENWRPDWDSFPWAGESAAAERWRRGQTGEPIVDAAMREMYVTGRMHNRARMIVASYLTKHLLTDWRIGLAWFEDCLIDHDPAANAMGWQWVAGCGPDAAPYFRIFNPASQAEKFDPEGRYRRAWLAEGNRHAPQTAQDFFAAVPRSWGLVPGAALSAPLIDLAAGRDRALAAYAAWPKTGQTGAGAATIAS
ncbi:cryptochrome/photolyase family protein [Rhodobacter capsulatus]|uniref:cryptochrome/photolyase family protein n=1 Tax=Rhodobacter capsulatus TaxID=1061 RepID=UPI0003D36691|nr:deoxyribodipyrimidine photo-lyase [Rhodobacter capsulatus]ETD88708.1 deoxyribodipyrimidine photo-lyase [Rhodobacter capsulatus YW2]